MTKKPIPPFRLFTLLLVGFLVGVGLTSFLSLDWQRCEMIFLTILIALSLTALSNCLLRNYLWSLSSFVLIFVFLGAAHYSFFEFKHSKKVIYDKEIEIEGKIVERPERDYDSQKAIIAFDEQRVLVSLPHYPYFQYGDRIKFKGKVQPIENFAANSPGYEKHLKKRLVSGVVSQSKGVEAVSGKNTALDKIYVGLYSVSDHFESTINSLYPEPHAALAGGILLGLKKNLPDDYMEALNASGLTHIVALSGYNVTVIISTLSLILIAYLSRKKVFYIGGGLVLLFVLMTGASSSVVRAAIFSMLILFGKTIGRKADMTNLLLATAVMMVLFNPFVLIYDVGFQLSFLAFAGLIYLSPLVTKFFENERYRVFPEAIKSPLIETLSAQIMVLPLILHEFGRLSLIAPLSNVLVLWTLPLAMLLTFLTGLFGVVFQPLGKLLSLFSWPVLEYIVKVPQILAKVPLASLEMQKGLWPVELLMFMAIAIVVKFYYKKLKIII